MLRFLVGTVVGGIASYYWCDKIRDYISEGAPDVRRRAADSLGTLGDRAAWALDQARSRIDTAVRKGQARLRPSDTAGQQVQSGSADTRHNPSGTISRN